MDRGIKIAILVACLLSLGLGIVWARVIDVVRPGNEAANDPLLMEPDRVSATIGAPQAEAERPVAIERIMPEPPPTSEEDHPHIEDEASSEKVVVAADGEWPAHIAPHIRDGKYIMQDGDNYWKLARNSQRFKFLFESKGIDYNDWQKANAHLDDRKIRPGTALTIPSK
ncbi:MAG: LysM peptidoglycan-binding domain-containing protein [Planctomycetes bacterium]|nr:LysM peptidoglycan-binding domain-containing protein [Planctomycetota bacterium]